MKGRKVGIIGSIKKDCVKDRIERRARIGYNEKKNQGKVKIIVYALQVYHSLIFYIYSFHLSWRLS